MRKCIAVCLAAMVGCTLAASEVSEKKIRQISRIVAGEFNKVVVVPTGKRAKAWQYADNPKGRPAIFAKVKAAIFKRMQAQVKPFETKAKQDVIPPKTRAQIRKRVADRFSYKTPAEIAMGALKEAAKAYPLVKVGDEVIIRYYRGGIFSKVSGKVQSIRDNGGAYEIGNTLVRVSEIVKDDQKYFDPLLNHKLRQEFVDNFQDPRKYAKLKRDYEARLVAEELEKLVSNEAKGYIFFRDKWVTAKYVAEQLIIYYQKRTIIRLDDENKYIVRGGRAPVKKKK